MTRLMILTAALLASLGPRFAWAEPPTILLSMAAEVTAPPPADEKQQPANKAEKQAEAAADQPAGPAWKPLQQLGVNIAAPQGKMPTNHAARLRGDARTNTQQLLVRSWPQLTYQWTAAGSRHYPLYFEEINAERYGYTSGHCLQPALSAAHFFGTIPALPYLMAADCPRECVYTLGHYRPGSCNPWRKHWWPLRVDSAVVEAGAVVGMVALIP